MTRTLLRVAGVLVLAALLVGPSAQARAPHAPDQHARPCLRAHDERVPDDGPQLRRQHGVRLTA